MSNDIQLFKKQERIYPKRVSGTFRTLKWIAMVVCLAIYYLVPFIRWDRGPYVPDQAVLIDLAHGRGYWFGLEIWPQEVYILTGVFDCGGDWVVLCDLALRSCVVRIFVFPNGLDGFVCVG